MLGGLLWTLLIGLAAGWLAGQIMKSPRSSLVVDLIVGVVGSVVGSVLFRLVGLASTGLVGELVTATVGAAALIAGLRAIGR
jgi:uncharacterized membrane protein YeaQ/YmgE (transglycosylase-associated protein family)